jgi:hypothetical protein
VEACAAREEIFRGLPHVPRFLPFSSYITGGELVHLGRAVAETTDTRPGNNTKIVVVRYRFRYFLQGNHTRSSAFTLCPYGTDVFVIGQ